MLWTSPLQCHSLSLTLALAGGKQRRLGTHTPNHTPLLRYSENLTAKQLMKYNSKNHGYDYIGCCICQHYLQLWQCLLNIAAGVVLSLGTQHLDLTTIYKERKYFLGWPEVKSQNEAIGASPVGGGDPRM